MRRRRVKRLSKPSRRRSVHAVVAARLKHSVKSSARRYKRKPKYPRPDENGN